MKHRATTRNNDATVDTRHGFPASLPSPKIGTKVGGRLQKFFLEYLKDGNARAAGRRAGYSEKWAKVYSYGHLKKYEDYVKWLRAQYAQEVVKLIAIEQEPVLQRIARIAFATEHDYLTLENGKFRRKKLEELTREEMIAIRIVKRPNGTLDYELRDTEHQLENLAKHLGLFNEKIILEHRHAHLHAHLDLTNVPIDELESIERALEKHMTMKQVTAQ